MCTGYPKRRSVWAVTRVLNGQRYVQLRSGITLSGAFTPIPEGEKGLWSCLASTLGIEHTLEKKLEKK